MSTLDRLNHIGRRFTSCAIANLPCVLVGIAMFIPAEASGQLSDEQPATSDQIQEQAADKMIEGIRSLLLPQQKRLARDMIAEYPDTELAKLAQELLDEYDQFDRLAAAEREEEEARTRQVRAYWDAVRLPPPPAGPAPTQITNRTDRPVLYQIKGTSMRWSGAFRLLEGETHKFNYSASFRTVTDTGITTYSLSQGNDYVFRIPSGGRQPNLFRSRRN